MKETKYWIEQDIMRYVQLVHDHRLRKSTALKHFETVLKHTIAKSVITMEEIEAYFN